MHIVTAHLNICTQHTLACRRAGWCCLAILLSEARAGILRNFLLFWPSTKLETDFAFLSFTFQRELNKRRKSFPSCQSYKVICLFRIRSLKIPPTFWNGHFDTCRNRSSRTFQIHKSLVSPFLPLISFTEISLTLESVTNGPPSLSDNFHHAFKLYCY